MLPRNADTADMWSFFRPFIRRAARLGAQKGKLTFACTAWRSVLPISPR